MPWTLMNWAPVGLLTQKAAKIDSLAVRAIIDENEGQNTEQRERRAEFRYFPEINRL